MKREKKQNIPDFIRLLIVRFYIFKKYNLTAYMQQYLLDRVCIDFKGKVLVFSDNLNFLFYESATSKSLST